MNDLDRFELMKLLRVAAGERERSVQVPPHIMDLARQEGLISGGHSITPAGTRRLAEMKLNPPPTPRPPPRRTLGR